ncbi:MAG: protein of unknown function transrane [Enterovirga sp.]|nr:protein of unknown function transrane [Enterovirga sp.]
MLRPALQPRTIGLLALAVTIAGWGLNWPIIKILLKDWPPLFGRGVAGTVAALLLAGLALWRGERVLVPARMLGRLALAGFTNVFAWMGFTTLALLWVSVAEAALLVYTMPLWVTVLEWPLRGRRPTGRRLGALALGFTGVAVLLGGQINASVSPGWAAGIALLLSAAILFAAGTVLLRPPAELSPLTATAWQVGLACAPMIVLGLLFERDRIEPLSPEGAAAFAYMTLLPMGACYMTWFAALRRLPPATASLAMLLVPIIGIVSATLLLGEPLGLRECLAIALTMSGVALALRTDG